VALAVWVAAQSSTTPSAQGAPLQALAVTDQAHVAVRGVGVVQARPDVAYVQLGIETQNGSLADAQWDAGLRANSVVKALEEGGVEEKDIATARYAVEPLIQYPPNEPPRQVGYKVSHSLRATIRSVDQTGKLIDAATAAGATVVNSVSFGFSDPNGLVVQARDAAMADAEAKAAQLAGKGGVSLGAPLSIEEVGINAPPSPNRPRGFYPGPNTESAGATNVQPGEMQVQVEISVVYALGK
jgi:uncharacterized protein YggE